MMVNEEMLLLAYVTRTRFYMARPTVLLLLYSR